MSWITNIAGKAENLLNNIDQAAGQIITHNNNDDYTSSLKHSQKTNLSQHEINMTSHDMLKNQFIAPELLNTNNSVFVSINKTNSQSLPSSLKRYTNSPISTLSDNGKKKDKDEEFFEFLNSKDTNLKNSRGSSVSSGKSENVFQVISQQTVSNLTQSSSNDDHVPFTIATKTNNDIPHQLELENKLLKTEISALNNEMNDLIKRVKNADIDVQKLRNQLTKKSHDLTEADQIVRELSSKEIDFNEALRAKDSQLAILRVRYEETHKELMTKTEALNELQNEKSRILQDHTSVSGVQSFALESLKEELDTCQRTLEKEKNEYEIKEKIYLDRICKLENQYQAISESLVNTQARLDETNLSKSDFVNQLKTAKLYTEGIKKELNDYKEKASRILQAKEKLIDGLKSGDSSQSELVVSEINELREEKDFLREELHQSRINLESLRSELQDMEVQQATDSEEANEKLSLCRDELEYEKSKVRDLEYEVNRQKQQLNLVGTEKVKLKTSLQSKLKEKEIEVENLRSQLLSKPVNNGNMIELENRLHSLTESLIQKQTMLETMATEKNAINLQMERMQQQCKDLKATSVRSTLVNIGDDDEMRQRMPVFMRESAADSNVTRRVKRAANTIDGFSIRLGIVLRRYPIARVFVIAYMLLLHLWVMVVLLTYQPEMHSKEFNLGAPKEPAPADH